MTTTSKTKATIDIDTVRALLQEGRAQEALDVIAHTDQKAPAWQNAKGVCLLRLGRYEEAMTILRDVVYPENRIAVPEDMPALYRANFATALLLTHRMDGAMSLTEQTDPNGHPYAAQVLSFIRQWKKKLTFPQRMASAVGWYPDIPVYLDFPPGAV